MVRSHELVVYEKKICLIAVIIVFRMNYRLVKINSMIAITAVKIKIIITVKNYVVKIKVATVLDPEKKLVLPETVVECVHINLYIFLL